MGRDETKFQGHIITSYKRGGGYARKWASEWQKGPPDLVCSMPMIGLHLVEVKHRPTFSKIIKNPMEKKQQDEAARYMKAGGIVALAIVRGEYAIQSEIAYMDPLRVRYDARELRWYPYKAGEGFPIAKLIADATEGHGSWQI